MTEQRPERIDDHAACSPLRGEHHAGKTEHAPPVGVDRQPERIDEPTRHAAAPGEQAARRRGSRGTGRGRGTAVDRRSRRAGHETHRCGAARRDGGVCGIPAGRGTEHPGIGRCKLHGGSTPTHAAAAARQLLERDARAALERLDVQPVGDPLRALQALAGEVLAWKDVLAGYVAELRALGYRGGMAGEQIRAEVVLYERAMDRATAVLVAIARLNIDERLARVTEAQRLLVVRAVEAGLSAAGITGPAAIDAKRVVSRALRAIDAGEPVDQPAVDAAPTPVRLAPVTPRW